MAVLLVGSVVATIGVSSKLNSDAWSLSPSEAVITAARGVLLECVDDVSTECVSSRMSRATLLLGPVATNAAYELVRDENPLFAYACHGAGHAAGLAAYQQSQVLEVALGYRGPACQGSYMHGVFDGWAGSRAMTNSAFDSVLPICESATGYHGVYYCFEGYGHAAWLLTHDLGRAVDMCGRSRKWEARQGCLEGVVMQRWAPVVGEKNSADRLDDIVPACRTLAPWMTGTVMDEAFGPEIPEAGSSIDACLRAATYPLGLFLIDVTRGDDVAWRDATSTFISRCNTYHAAGDRVADADRDRCLVEYGEYAFFYSEANPVAANSWCNLLPEAVQGACLRRVAEAARENA